MRRTWRRVGHVDLPGRDPRRLAARPCRLRSGAARTPAADGGHCTTPGPSRTRGGRHPVSAPAPSRTPADAGGRTAAARRLVLLRLAAALILVLVVPLVIGLGAVADEQPVREGEPSPRTILADQQLRIEDTAQTDQARAVARETVEPVLVTDGDAQAAIVADARAVFAAARSVREPEPADDDEDGAAPARGAAAQRTALAAEQPVLDGDLVAELVALSDADLEVVRVETIQILQELARQRIADDELDAEVEDALRTELALRGLPGDTGEAVVAPLVRLLMRPTVVVDPEATAAARDRAAEAAGEVSQVWAPGEAIVREGQMVDALQQRAVEQLGLEGTSPLRSFLRAVLAMVLVTAIAGLYLSRMQPRVWTSVKKLVLLSGLTTAYAGLVIATSVLTDIAATGWAYSVPAGAFAMLVAILIHPVVGIATMLPAAVLVLLVSPSAAPVALFAASAVLVSVPLTTRIASRSDLRSATLRAGISYPVIAGAIVGVFGPRDDLWTALLAAAVNGLVTALVVQGALPFLETLFRLPTVTALLDLSDRNHPLLRELESKALGSYNHSVMVASLTERACRAVGADPLLGTVAALYHDIGKVRQPHFFIENQQGIANPHDELEPEVSAVIIQNHVVDGVEMATEYKLPPEVVACIGSHHGTMLVGYFYDKAVKTAEAEGRDPDSVDESHFRYKGGKPRSKEAAILLLADCCEATTRAMAMSRGTLPRDEIEATVDKLLQERVDDGQFDACDLTFRELRVARDTVVESLVGIYHPRIAYPSGPSSEPGTPATAGTRT
ncbi:HDIG domain-containing protein [Nitriliruptoraceae bacterium ZYF776]|nr:HDIG domain-containing protein [Profundirhabdus halotolerans]